MTLFFVGIYTEHFKEKNEVWKKEVTLQIRAAVWQCHCSLGHGTVQFQCCGFIKTLVQISVGWKTILKSPKVPMQLIHNHRVWSRYICANKILPVWELETPEFNTMVMLILTFMLFTQNNIESPHSYWAADMVPWHRIAPILPEASPFHRLRLWGTPLEQMQHCSSEALAQSQANSFDTQWTQPVVTRLVSGELWISVAQLNFKKWQPKG
jgi:hypothetical protein